MALVRGTGEEFSGRVAPVAPRGKRREFGALIKRKVGRNHRLVPQAVLTFAKATLHQSLMLFCNK
jgi:hypothetical protein